MKNARNLSTPRNLSTLHVVVAATFAAVLACSPATSRARENPALSAVLRQPFPPEGEISQAEVFIRKPTQGTPTAVVVLCPGQNGDGSRLLGDPAWIDFAVRHRAALASFHFVSPDAPLRQGRGYFDSARGSGRILLAALDREGLAEKPLLLYGFSGGAHFTDTFARGRLGKVAAWCAYSAAWWQPATGHAPAVPALVVCGDRDAARYGPSLAHFQQGRKAGLPWAWISLAGKGHRTTPALDRFVRAFFSAVLSENDSESAVVVDNETAQVVEPDGRQPVPALTSVLPDRSLLPAWRELHRP